MSNFFAHSLIAMLLFIAGGCSSSEIDALPIAENERVPIRGSINVGRVTSQGVFMIRSVDDYVQLTGESVESAEQSLAKIDFSSETVLIAALGECNTTGYSIQILGIGMKDDTLNVHVRQGTPSGDGPVGMAFTYPTHAVVLEKLPESLKVNVVDGGMHANLLR